MSRDSRSDVYGDLHQGQLARQEETTHYSASVILKMLREYYAPGSMLDVGCGLGIWLKAATELGINDVLGIEGAWIKNAKLAVPSAMVREFDLERPFSLGRCFDLVLCSEVGEHLPPKAAPGLVDSLVAHSDHVLFSAAIPFQGGHHHLNEQYLDYWVGHFARHHFVLLDLFRPTLWDDARIHWWLRQNLVLFVSRSTAEGNPALREELKIKRPVSIVHPGMYYQRVASLFQQVNQQARLLQEKEKALAQLIEQQKK